MPNNIPAHKQTDPSKAPGQFVPAAAYRPTHGGYPNPPPRPCEQKGA